VGNHNILEHQYITLKGYEYMVQILFQQIQHTEIPLLGRNQDFLPTHQRLLYKPAFTAFPGP